ncbi:MAG: GxxExxY protein [Candidatus Marinimicrobia bacterium]|nr:GxxExxY protein [Candidatus Neomarinimicrobiota bacterium]
MNENNIAAIIVDCAYQIHVKTGPGLFESVYEAILEEYLKRRGLSVKRQVIIPVQFENIEFNKAFVADLIVNDMVVIELKSKPSIGDIDKKQLLTYVKLTGYKLGILINFGDALIKNGIKRIINGEIK